MPRLNNQSIEVEKRLAELGKAHQQRTIYPLSAFGELPREALYNNQPDGSRRPVFPVKRPFLNSPDAKQTLGDYVRLGKGA